MGLFGEDQSREDRENAAESMATVDGALLADACIEAVRAGWMLSFSSSRDGFALRVAVMADGEREAKWCESAADLDRALSALVTSAKGGTLAQPRSTPRKGSKRA